MNSRNPGLHRLFSILCILGEKKRIEMIFVRAKMTQNSQMSVKTRQISSAETGHMSAVEAGEMSAAAASQMPAVETRQISTIATGLCPA